MSVQQQILDLVNQLTPQCTDEKHILTGEDIRVTMDTQNMKSGLQQPARVILQHSCNRKTLVNVLRNKTLLVDVAAVWCLYYLTTFEDLYGHQPMLTTFSFIRQPHYDNERHLLRNKVDTEVDMWIGFLEHHEGEWMLIAKNTKKIIAAIPGTAPLKSEAAMSIANEWLSKLNFPVENNTFTVLNTGTTSPPDSLAICIKIFLQIAGRKNFWVEEIGYTITPEFYNRITLDLVHWKNPTVIGRNPKSIVSTDEWFKKPSSPLIAISSDTQPQPSTTAPISNPPPITPITVDPTLQNVTLSRMVSSQAQGKAQGKPQRLSLPSLRQRRMKEVSNTRSRKSKTAAGERIQTIQELERFTNNSDEEQYFETNMEVEEEEEDSSDAESITRNEDAGREDVNEDTEGEEEKMEEEAPSKKRRIITFSSYSDLDDDNQSDDLDNEDEDQDDDEDEDEDLDVT